MVSRAMGVVRFAAIFPAIFLLATGSRCGSSPVDVESVRVNANGKPLFCAFGGVGIISPAEPERELAVAVIEIESASEITNVALSNFILFDKKGRETKFNRVVSIEVFDRPHLATEGSFDYYIDPGGTRPWTGTLPAGKIRLRVTVELPSAPKNFPVKFRVVFGKNSIEGPVDGQWPTA